MIGRQSEHVPHDMLRERPEREYLLEDCLFPRRHVIDVNERLMDRLHSCFDVAFMGAVPKVVEEDTRTIEVRRRVLYVVERLEDFVRLARNVRDGELAFAYRVLQPFGQFLTRTKLGKAVDSLLVVTLQDIVTKFGRVHEAGQFGRQFPTTNSFQKRREMRQFGEDRARVSYFLHD